MKELKYFFWGVLKFIGGIPLVIIFVPYLFIRIIHITGGGDSKVYDWEKKLFYFIF